MDDSLQNLENELKALRPRRPSSLLRARLEQEFAKDESAAAMPAPVIHTAVSASSPRRYTSATTLRSWKWAGWQLAAAASVALLVSLGVWQWNSRPPTEHPAPQIARTDTTVQGATDTAPRAVPLDESRRAMAAAPGSLRPVKAANVLYDVRDEGVVLLEDNTPARQVRTRYVDTYTWKNPATNASMKWSVPRDEVRMMPASFH